MNLWGLRVDSCAVGVAAHSWIMADGTVSLIVANYTNAEVELLWVAEDRDEERSYLRVPKSETRTQVTFPKHVWRCRSVVDAELLWTVTLGQVDLNVAVGTPPVVAGAASVDAVTKESVTDAFYSHHLEVGTAGLCVRAHQSVSAAAVNVAAEVVRSMLVETPTAILSRLEAARCSISVIGREQLTSDVPEHAFLSGATSGNWEYDATTRGVGGNPGVPITSVGEENLVEDEAEPAAEAAEAAQAGTGGAAVTGEAVPSVMDLGFAMECDSAPYSPPHMATAMATATTTSGVAPAPMVVESDAAAAAAAASSLDADGEVAAMIRCQCVCCGGDAPSPEPSLRRRRVRDAYAHESTLVHEFGHCVMDVGLDDDARQRIRLAHARALEAGLVDKVGYISSYECSTHAPPPWPLTLMVHSCAR